MLADSLQVGDADSPIPDAEEPCHRIRKVHILVAGCNRADRVGDDDAFRRDRWGRRRRSTLSRCLCEASDAVQCVHIDDFYRPNPSDEEVLREPCWFIDWRRVRDEVLEPLSCGRDAVFRPYDWDAGELSDSDIAIEPGGIVVIEGISSFRRELRDWIDVGLWVETPAALRLSRGLARDGEDARAQWVDNWMVEESRYFDAHQPHRLASVLIEGTRSSLASVEPSTVRVIGQHELEEAPAPVPPARSEDRLPERSRAAVDVDAEFAAADVEGLGADEFADRFGSYALIRNDDGELALVDVDGRLFLPGGGWERGESAVQALHRELDEELGWSVAVDDVIGAASYRLRAQADRRLYRKIGFFYQAARIDSEAVRSEPSHRVRWVAAEIAVEALHEPSHAWAVADESYGRAAEFSRIE